MDTARNCGSCKWDDGMLRRKCYECTVGTDQWEPKDAVREASDE